jgi:hypothetical protein
MLARDNNPCAAKPRNARAHSPQQQQTSPIAGLVCLACTQPPDTPI